MCVCIYSIYKNNAIKTLYYLNPKYYLTTKRNYCTTKILNA